MQKFYSSYGHLYSNVRTGSAAINQFLGTFQVSEWHDQDGDQHAHHLDPYQLHLFWELCVSRHQEADFRWFFTQYVAPLKENQAQLQQEWRDPYNQQLGTNPDLNRHPHESICSYWIRLANQAQDEDDLYSLKYTLTLTNAQKWLQKIGRDSVFPPDIRMQVASILGTTDFRGPSINHDQPHTVFYANHRLHKKSEKNPDPLQDYFIAEQRRAAKTVYSPNALEADLLPRDREVAIAWQLCRTAADRDAVHAILTPWLALISQKRAAILAYGRAKTEGRLDNDTVIPIPHRFSVNSIADCDSWLHSLTNNHYLPIDIRQSAANLLNDPLVVVEA